MRVSRSSLVGLALATLAACGKTADGPLEVEPSPIDFGEVVSPDQSTRTVTLTNRTRRPLLLDTPRFDCSCFALTAPPPAVLSPGESTRLVILMDSTKTDPKRFNKTLSIATDDPVAPLVRIPVVGEVAEYRRWDAVRVDLGRVDATAADVEHRFAVRGGEGFTVEAKDAVASDPRLRTAVRAASPGYHVVVTVPKGAAKGPLHAQVQTTLVVEGRGKPARTIRDVLWVTGTIQ